MPDKQNKNIYTANSTLVLRSNRSGNKDDIPTGEAESLYGKITKKDFGVNIKSTVEEHKKQLDARKRLRSERDSKDDPINNIKKLKDGNNYSDVFDKDFDINSYNIVSKESKEYYGLILNSLQNYLGDIPNDILKNAANEVIEIVHDDERTDIERKEDIENIIMGKIPEDQFTNLKNLAKRITDFKKPSVSTNNTRNDDVGVSIIFEEEEEEGGPNEDAYLEDVVSNDGRDEDFGEDADTGMVLGNYLEDEIINKDQNDPLAKHDEVIGSSIKESKPKSEIIDISEIDVFWIQRKISEYVDDPHIAEIKANKVFEILSSSTDSRDVENSLMELFDYENFSLVKLFTVNMRIIYWSIRLAKVSDTEKLDVIDEIKNSDDHEILKQLNFITAQKSKKAKKINIDIKKTKLDITDRSFYPRAIDFDLMKFKQGGHLMSNRKCILPAGTEKKEFKGYQEVHIPAPKPEPLGEKDVSIAITDLPKWAQPAFSGAKKLNRVQSRVFPIAFDSDENMLLCAPTGAGKTNCAMLTVLHEIGKHIDETTGELDLNSFKIVYVAPMKALVSEMVGNFSSRLNEYGISVIELTGDSQQTKQQLSDAQIIVTTPEKWDVVTRKATDTSYTRLVKLLIIDEVHLLHDDRGPVLEAIIARTIRNSEELLDKVRLIGLSATLPNYMDVAKFMKVNLESGVFFFNNSFRPCPLEQQYVGITDNKGIRRFQMMNEITYNKILENSGKNQMIVFVHSRKDTAKTANVIKDIAIEKDSISKLIPLDPSTREILKSESENVTNSDLMELLPYGLAIHHAGLSKEDRTLVEDLFADGHIQVLFSTATLAWGVNLPAHTVIIKGTQIYNAEKGSWVELSPQDVLQMLGRAGRPQYDTHGEGIIITTQKELQFYLSLLNQQLPIESQLISRITDIVNAEIVLGTINSIDDLITWLEYTYLYIRMQSNGSIYGVSNNELKEDSTLKQKRLDIAHAVALELDKCNLIIYDKTKKSLSSTELGKIASYYYISNSTITTFNTHLKPTMGLIDIFRIFSLSDEFKSLSVRDEEKVELLELIERLPIPIAESIEDNTAKVNILLQAYISQMKLNGFALFSDMIYITQSAERIMRALFEICLRRGWSSITRKILNLCKIIEHRSWLSMSPLRQIGWFPLDLIQKLEKKEFPWSKYFDLNTQELGELIGITKAGRVLHKAVHQFPRLELKVNIQPISRSYLKLDLIITPDFIFDEDICKGFSEQFWIIVEDVNGEKILYYDIFLLRHKYSEDEHYVSFVVPILEPLQPNYFVSVISDRWLHCETKIPITLRNMILPIKASANTELLDMQLLEPSILNNKQFEEIYKSYKNFNSIQSQIFKTIYDSDNNCLISASPGAGKTTCAEFGLLRMFIKYEKSRCIFMSCKPEKLDSKYKLWKKKFGKIMGGKSIVKLTGELSTDLKLIELGDIIFTTPQNWDLISKRFKQRKSLHTIRLFIVDNLHLLNENGLGESIEVGVSRLRLFSHQLDLPIRIIGLSASLTTSRDIGEWIGAKKSTIYNFSPSIRPSNLEIHIQGYNINHYPSLMIAMTKPIFNIINENKNNQSIVFTSTRRQSQLSAMDIMSLAISYNNDGYLGCKLEEISDYIDSITDSNLKVLLQHGIGYLHSGLSINDHKIVEGLFQSGVIRAIFCPYSLSWSLNLRATNIVLMGTSNYNGKLHSYIEYSLPDVLEMVGKVQNYNSDDANLNSIYIMCNNNKKEYYKTFINEPLSIESVIDQNLNDIINSEIVNRTIKNNQEAIDYLTWTYFYRRLTMNPNYYNLLKISPEIISKYLSNLIEKTISELTECKLIEVEKYNADENNNEGMEEEIISLNLGMIASYYNLSYITIDLINKSIGPKMKLNHILQIICASIEFDNIPIRNHENKTLNKLYSKCPLKVDEPNFEDPHFKIFILLQSHFQRIKLPIDLELDKNDILPIVIKIIQATVDIISFNGWILPCLTTMEISQMIIQGMWNTDTALIQIPHITPVLAKIFKEDYNIETVIDIMMVDDDIRENMLKDFKENEIQDIANFVNEYPDIEINYEIITKSIIKGDIVSLNVQLERQVEEEDDDEEKESEEIINKNLRFINSTYYPKPKEEKWWIVVVDKITKTILTVKKISFNKTKTMKLDFITPEDLENELQCKMYFICDSYLGIDQEFDFKISIEDN